MGGQGEPFASSNKCLIICKTTEHIIWVIKFWVFMIWKIVQWQSLCQVDTEKISTATDAGSSQLMIFTSFWEGVNPQLSNLQGPQSQQHFPCMQGASTPPGACGNLPWDEVCSCNLGWESQQEWEKQAWKLLAAES